MDSFRNIRDDGILKVPSSADRLLLIPTDGTVVEELDTNALYIYNATSATWIAVGGGGGGGLPPGGTTNQALTKIDSTNYNTQWSTIDKSFVGLGNVDNVSLLAQDLAQKEPTGLPNRSDSTISFNSGTREFSISPVAASFDVWIKGVKYTKTSANTITISTTAGNHYIYFDSTGNLQETTTFTVDLFIDNAMVSIVYWNSDNNTAPYFADERHGMQMDGATHGYLHTVFGARYLTGLALQGFDADGTGNVNSNAQFTSDSGTIRDEDILLSLSAQAQIPILFRQGSLWRKKTADSFPVIYNGTAGYTGTRIPYNQFITGNWQLTEATDANYVLVHFFATNDINNGVIGILGINEYANAPQARAGADTEIQSLSGLPFAEFTAIGSVIFQTRTSYTNTPKARVVSSNPSIGEVYVDFRGEQLYTPSGVATSHSLLSNLSSDDHTQYFNQTRGDARYLQLTGGALTGPVTSTSTLGIGLTSPIAPLQVSTVNKVVSPTLYTSDYIAISAEETSPGFNIITSGSSAGNRGVYKSTRSRGTLDVPTAVQSGDQTFSLVAAGHDGTTNITTAGITFAVDGTVSTGTVPQCIAFSTGVTSPRLERMRINSTGQVGINFIPSAASSTLTVKSTAVPSTAESIASFFVTDSSASLNIGNGSTVDGTFVPSLAFTQATGNTNSTSLYQGFITLSDDTGTQPVHTFRTQTQNAGVYAAVTTRPLYQWKNWTTDVMTVLANGNLGIGTTTPSQKLEVQGQAVISGAASAGQALLRVTNTGAGDCLVVEDAANPDASNFKIDANGFIYTGSLLSTVGSSGRMQILDSQNALIECIAGATNSVVFGASNLGNKFGAPLGSINIFTTDSGTDVSISPVLGDGFGPSIYTTSNGSNLVTGINNITPTEALDVTGNVKVSGTITSETSVFAPNLFNIASSVAYVTPNVSTVATSVSSTIGCGEPSFSGTKQSILPPTGTSYYTSKKIQEIITTSGSTAVAGWRFGTEYLFRGSAPGIGGFKFVTSFGYASGFSASQSARRTFCGVTDSTLAPTDVNPSSLGLTQEMFGVGFDNGDANFSIMHSNGTATATKIDLGSSFARPTADKANMYQVILHAVSNDTKISYQITNLITGAVAKGSVSTNLPNTTTALSPRCWLSAGGTAISPGVAYEYIYLQNS